MNRGPLISIVPAALLVFVPAGCAVLLAFPDDPEVDDADCHDGRDNDLDGLLDAADPGCDPFYPEEAPLEGGCTREAAARCYDGRDNDQDGLVDHHDPGCWPCAAFTLSRHASVAGTDDYQPDDHAGDWSTDDVFFDGDAMVVAPGAGRASATMNQLLSGALDGFSIEGELFVDPAALTMLCVHGADQGAGHFYPPCEQLTEAGFSGVRLVVGRHEVLDGYDGQLDNEDRGRALTLIELAPARWRTFRIEVSEGLVRVSIDGAEDLLEVPVPRAWAANVPLRFSWSGWPFGGASPALRGLRFRRSAFHPEGHPVPQIAQPAHGVAPRSVATDGNRQCALSGRTPLGTRHFLGLAAFVSDGASGSWQARGTRFPPGLDADRVFSASVVWDERAHLFRAVVAYEFGAHEPLLMTSRDCVIWDALGSLSPPPDVEWENGLFAYGFDDVGQHEVVVAFGDVSPSTWIARSADGAPDDFRWSESETLRLESGLIGLEVARLQRQGGNLVLTQLGEHGGSSMFVSGSDGWRHVPAWDLRASGEVGTFDRAAVFPGVFLAPISEEDTEAEFTVFYAGDGDFSCWAPDDPCPCRGDCIGGTGTAHLSIRSRVD